MCHVTHDLHLFLDLHTLRFYLNVNYLAGSWLERSVSFTIEGDLRVFVLALIDHLQVALFKALKLF